MFFFFPDYNLLGLSRRTMTETPPSTGGDSRGAPPPLNQIPPRSPTATAALTHPALDLEVPKEDLQAHRPPIVSGTGTEEIEAAQGLVQVATPNVRQDTVEPPSPARQPTVNAHKEDMQAHRPPIVSSAGQRRSRQPKVRSKSQLPRAEKIRSSNHHRQGSQASMLFTLRNNRPG